MTMEVVVVVQSRKQQVRVQGMRVIERVAQGIDSLDTSSTHDSSGVKCFFSKHVCVVLSNQTLRTLYQSIAQDCVQNSTHERNKGR